MGGIKDNADCYFAASAMAVSRVACVAITRGHTSIVSLPNLTLIISQAIVNFPLWKASAIAQAGFKTPPSSSFFRSWYLAMQPPYKGVGAVLLGMT
jgi:hypothetical protein